jgi:hypothetical protein
MALNAKKIKHQGGTGGNKQEPLEVGTYEARVVCVLDMGLQAQRPYQGQDKPPAYSIRLTYELCDEFMLDEDGNEMEDKPRWISEEFPLRSLESDLAKSTKRYNAIDPKDESDGDFTKLIGKACMVTVGQYEGKNGASITAKKAAKLPELINPPQVFLLDEPNLEVFNALPDWLKDKIKDNLEYKGSALEKALKGGKVKEEPEEEPEADEPEADEEW